VLQIKPILRMHSGEFDMERVRTRNGASARLLELLTPLAPFEKLTLVHTHALDKAQLLRQKASHLFPDDKEPMVAEVTPSSARTSALGPQALWPYRRESRPRALAKMETKR